MLSGCGTLRYFWQAGVGQLELINRAKPIDDVLKDERTPPRTRKLLAEIPAIKMFGESRGLKPTSNYTDYVKLNRSAAVWVVNACEPLRFKSKEWSFPIVGSFPYLGWFDPDSARKFGDELEREGWDASVRGAGAYSTLGWFRDAVLSTMISEGPEALGDLVNVVLHESVHASLYINGQSFFNESVASFAADRMTFEYLDQARGPGSPERVEYKRAQDAGVEREKKYHDAYGELQTLYESNAPDPEKLAKKTVILERLRSAVKTQRKINNATLVQFKTYNVGMEGFARLFEACGSDWGRFWKSLRTLETSSFGSGQLEFLDPILNSLASRGC